MTYGDPDSQIGIVTWGSTAGVAIEAIDRLSEIGVSAALVAPRMVMPLPDAQLGDFMKKTHIIIPEVNYRGQFADLIQAKYPRPVARVNVYGGRPLLWRSWWRRSSRSPSDRWRTRGSCWIRSSASWKS